MNRGREGNSSEKALSDRIGSQGCPRAIPGTWDLAYDKQQRESKQTES